MTGIRPWLVATRRHARHQHSPCHYPSQHHGTHCPATQLCPAAHFTPHPAAPSPQLLGSVWVTVHVPLQSVWPVGHTHSPATQVLPPVHFAPQPAGGEPVPEPQLLMSVIVFVQ